MNCLIVDGQCYVVTRSYYHVWNCQLFIRELQYNGIIIFQSTVYGARGMNGAHATKRVVRAVKAEPESVTALHQHSVERIARAMLPRLLNAMNTPVQVKLLDDVSLYQ